jgi:hypothetical protein
MLPSDLLLQVALWLDEPRDVAALLMSSRAAAAIATRAELPPLWLLQQLETATPAKVQALLARLPCTETAAGLVRSDNRLHSWGAAQKASQPHSALAVNSLHICTWLASWAAAQGWLDTLCWVLRLAVGGDALQQCLGPPKAP